MRAYSVHARAHTGTHGRAVVVVLVATMSSAAADVPQERRNVVCNGKDDVPVVAQPTTRGGVRVYKIVVLGDGGVGKSGNSSISRRVASRRAADLEEDCVFIFLFRVRLVSAVTLQFVNHRFLDYHDPTIGKFVCVVLLREEYSRGGEKRITITAARV